MSLDTDLTTLFEDNLEFLDAMDGPGADKAHLMSVLMENTYHIGRHITLDPDLTWDAATTDYLEDSEVFIVSHKIGLLFFENTLWSLLTNVFEHEHDWASACQQRSALAFLFSCYVDTDLPGLLDGVLDLERLDQQLRVRGAKENHLKAEDIPAGIPEDHWWWRIPRSSTT